MSIELKHSPNSRHVKLFPQLPNVFRKRWYFRFPMIRPQVLNNFLSKLKLTVLISFTKNVFFLNSLNSSTWRHTAKALSMIKSSINHTRPNAYSQLCGNVMVLNWKCLGDIFSSILWSWTILVIFFQILMSARLQTEDAVIVVWTRLDHTAVNANTVINWKLTERPVQVNIHSNKGGGKLYQT